MDSLSFHLVRPMNQLAQLSLLTHISSRSERLTSFNAKLIQRYALLDYVDHRRLLTILIEKVKQQQNQQKQEEQLLLLSFSGLRQTLQAVQRFPRELSAEKKEFESLFIESILTTPPDILSSIEYCALWSFTTQVTAWEDIVRISNVFPLQHTLPLQGGKEFRAILDQMLIASIPILSTGTFSYNNNNNNNNMDFASYCENSRGVRLLKELVGKETAMHHAIEGIIHKNISWNERESATSTFIGIVHALQQWPVDKIPSAEVWKEFALRPTSFHDVDLHQLLRVIIRIYSPIIPTYVRDSLEEAMSSDLWRCYLELPNEPVVIFFRQNELQWRIPFVEGLNNNNNNNLEDSNKTSTIQIQEIIKRIHERELEKQLRSDGPPLSLTVLINLFISSTFLQIQGELMDAIISALRCTLVSSFSSSSQRLKPLQAAIIATCIDKYQQSSSLLNLEKGKEDIEAIEKLLASILSYNTLKQSGSARCVVELLCECPQWTKQMKLEEGCFTLLREHVKDGFTKAQLERILEYNNKGILQIPVDVKDIIIHQTAELPTRL